MSLRENSGFLSEQVALLQPELPPQASAFSKTKRGQAVGQVKPIALAVSSRSVSGEAGVGTASAMTPVRTKIRPVPDSLYKAPLEVSALERQRAVNRRKAERTLQQAQAPSFACTDTAWSVKTTQRLCDIVTARERESQYTPSKPRKIPLHVRQAVPIKLNAAAILREENLLRRKASSEARRLKDLESGSLFDEAAFRAWQLAEETKERQRELEVCE